jgi:hypothetical protein
MESRRLVPASMYLMEGVDDEVADVEMEEILLEDIIISNVLLRLLSNKQGVFLVATDDESLSNKDRE